MEFASISIDRSNEQATPEAEVFGSEERETIPSFGKRVGGRAWKKVRTRHSQG